ncbi:MAG: (d)CMP kinase [Lachnospiraceae bacterium]|nr:(d)CMP kinase [Lachnospiraceae bacterium]
MKHHAIAIDGPSGAGKSTVARILAKELGFVFIDTGAMYRALAIRTLEEGIDATDQAAVEEAAERATVTIRFEDGTQHVFLDGTDVTARLRDQTVGDTASAISVYGRVRERMVELQQALAKEADVIMDGRDIGTVVLPGADLKIYLTASSFVRAKRRYDELIARGEQAHLPDIEQEIKERDHRDTTRTHSPLRRAEDAVEIDSSGLTIEEVVARIRALYEG